MCKNYLCAIMNGDAHETTILCKSCRIATCSVFAIIFFYNALTIDFLYSKFSFILNQLFPECSLTPTSDIYHVTARDHVRS